MIEDFFNNRKNHRLIRYLGFSMATVGMLAGIAAAIVAIVTGFTGLGFCAAGVMTLSFFLYPVTDINFSKDGY